MTEQPIGRGRQRPRPRPVTVATVSGGPAVPLITSPVRLCGWSFNAAAGGNAATEASSGVAATAAGTLNLTGFVGVARVDVTPAAAWPAGANVVTLSNVAGGPFTVEIEGGTANAVTFIFPEPIASNGTPQVSVPAIAAGPAYTISANGYSANPGVLAPVALGQLLDGGQVVGTTAQYVGLCDTQWLGEEGIYCGTNVSLQMFFGQMFGVLYVLDDWHGGDN